MATYTITVNEHTKEGRSVLALLRSLSSITFKKESPMDLTLKAIKEVEEGKYTRCKSFKEYKEAVKDL